MTDENMASLVMANALNTDSPLTIEFWRSWWISCLKKKNLNQIYEIKFQNKCGSLSKIKEEHSYKHKLVGISLKSCTNPKIRKKNIIFWFFEFVEELKKIHFVSVF